MAALGALAPSISEATGATRATPGVTVQLVGLLTIAWQGDPARGCAAEGLCGVSGSLQMLPSGQGGVSGGPPPIELSDFGAVARVTDASAGGAVTACADPVPVDVLFVVKHGAGGLQAVLESTSSPQPPSAGRCAGPTAADLSGLALPARKLGSHGYDLSGQTTFGAGPFTVTAISTVRALFARGGTNSGGIGGLGGIGSVPGILSVGRPVPMPRAPTTLEEHAEVDYRIEGLSGALSTSFAGLAAPLCAPLGACGVTGELQESFSGGGVISFVGSRKVKHRVGERAALADLRSGRLGLGGGLEGLPIAETTTETLTGPDGTVCSDRQTASALPASGLSSIGRRGVALILGPYGAGGPSLFGVDPLRTRCPGPSAVDVLGSSPLARASILASTLGAHRLEVTFQRRGSFTGSAYQGERGGSVVLSLVFERARGGTSRVPVGPPFPIRPPSVLP